nr:hypothetical protein [Tanacetum cinerariifolium]
DAQNEQLSNLHVDLLLVEIDLARACNLRGNVLGFVNRAVNQVFEQTGLDALRQAVRDGKLDHVVLLVAEGDEVVVDARL